MKILRSKTLAAFLKARGWREKEVDNRYMYLIPPEEMSQDEEDYFHIPLERLRDKPVYSRTLDTLVKSISSIYEIDIEILRKLFALKIDEIKTNPRYKQIFFPDRAKASL